jgi:MFS family permease
LVLWAIIASQFAPAFMFSGVAVALPSLAQDLDAGARAVGLVETLFLAGSASFLLPVGRYADATDARTLYRAGLVCFALLSAALACCTRVEALLLLRFAQGISAAVVTTTGGALLAQLAPAERRGRVFGAAIGATYAGLSFGPLCAGLLVELGGWRLVFLGGAALLFVFAAPVAALLDCRWRKPEKDAVHWPSALLLAAAVQCAVRGTASWRSGWSGPAGLLAAFALGAAFIAWQARLARPLVDLRQLRGNGPLASSLVVQSLLYMNAYANIVLLSLHLQVVLGRPAEEAGLILAGGAAFMALLAPWSGRLADRFGPRRMVVAGVAVILALACFASTLDADQGAPPVVFVLLLHGLGFALFSTPNMMVVMGALPPEQYSTASALSAQSRSLGMLGGMLVLAVLLSLAFGASSMQSDPARLLAAEHQAWAILAIAGALALLAALGSASRSRRAA